MSKPRLWTLSSESLITTIKLKLNPHENDWIGYASEELLRRAHAPLWLGSEFNIVSKLYNLFTNQCL